MRSIPSTPPPRMVFALALEYARRGYHIRPLSWDGSEGGHELAWLFYPEGFPLAYYVSSATGPAGRRWAADDLERGDWFAFWTVLPPECFEADADGNLPVCLCDTSDVNYSWSFYAWSTDETALDAFANPNVGFNGGECGASCECSSQSTTGSTGSTGGTTGTTGGGTSPTTPVSPLVPGSPGSPTPGSPGAPSPGNGNPVPSAPSPGGPGSPGGPKPPKRRTPTPTLPGPTLTVTPVRTSPTFHTGGGPEEHVWQIEVSLSGPAGVADHLYSVQLRVLAEIVGSWILAPGGDATVEFSRDMGPDDTPIPAIATGAAFGGGPACVTGSADLEPAPLEESSSSVASSSSSSSYVGGSSSSSVASSASSSASSSALSPHVLAFSVVDSSTACGLGGGSTYYADSGTLGNGVALYDDESGTEPSANGYYSTGTTWALVSSGVISSTGSCS